MIHHDFTNCYRFSNGQWNVVEDKQLLQNQNSENELKVGEYNVLFGMPNCVLDKFARNSMRFEHILNVLIPSCDPDILSLMEVTAEFMNLLLQNKNIRETYYVSHVEKIHQRHRFEVVVISKLPFSTIYTKDARLGRYQYSLFLNKEQEWKSFIVVSTHLWAGENDYKSRQKQIQLIHHSLQSNDFLQSNHIPTPFKQLAVQANAHNNVILQGDLNLHMRHEDSFIYENEFVDVWREQYPDQDGYTWDSQQNTFIKTVFLFDNRRMRLDRILMRKKCNLFSIQDIEIHGKERIAIGLTASDHYLLLAHLRINSSPTELKQQFDTSKIVMEKSTGQRTIHRIISIRKRIAAGIIITIICLAVGIPLFVIYR